MFTCGNGLVARVSATLVPLAKASVLRPWSDRAIKDCGEPLRPLRPALLCLCPHPYQSLGAPYGQAADPFVLREGVRQRLIAAEQQLRREHPDLCFAIFDAWRPIPFSVSWSSTLWLEGLALAFPRLTPLRKT